VEPKGSLLSSEEAVIGPCTEPDESSPQLHILFKIHFNIILSTPS